MVEPDLFLRIGGFLKWIGLCLLPVFSLPLLTLVSPSFFSGPSRLLHGHISSSMKIVLRVAMISAVALVLLQLAVVIASYVFALSWTWLSEAVIYAFATVFMLGASSALVSDAHVRVDILRPRFGKDGRHWIELAGTYLFLFPIMIRILMLSERGLTRSWSLLEGSRESDGLPLLFMFKTLVPLFAILMLAAGLAVALRAALQLTEQAPDDADDTSSGMERHYGA